MKTDNIQLVVLDMAGTTVRDRSEVENCFYQAAVDTGLTASKARIKDMQGLPKLIVVKTLWEEAGQADNPELPQLVDKTYNHFCHLLEEHYQTAEVVPTEGALEIFTWLREHGIKIALTTGFYRKVTDIILNRLGWLQGLDEQYQAIPGETTIIDLSLTPNETGKGRPHPDMIQHAMRHFQVQDPKQVIKIGDTPADLQAGAAAGVGLNLAVTNGTHSAEALSAYPHDYLLGSLAELVPTIQKHTAGLTV